MAKYVTVIHGDFDEFNQFLAKYIASTSISSSKEDTHEFDCPGMRCQVQVFERYSSFGSNRVSMNVTVVGIGDELQIAGITSGGSQGMLFKFNTVGEENFLYKLKLAVEDYLKQYNKNGSSC